MKKRHLLNPKLPDWYKEENLRMVWYAINEYSGWVVDLGDGTCRYANSPMLGEDGPKWGDRVPLVALGGEVYYADKSKIIDHYEPETKE